MPSALDLLKQNTSPTALQLLQQNTEKPNLPQAPEADEGFLSNLWKGAKTGVAGTYGGIAGWVGGENAATKYFDDVVNSNKRSHEYDGYSADYFTNGSGLAYDLGQLIGSIGSMAPAAFIPGVGAVGGAAARLAPRLLGSGFARSAAAKVGADAALSGAEKWAASKAGQNFIANAARYGTGSGAVESLSEGGSGVTEGFKNGDENPYLTGLEITAKNLPLLIASNTLEAATLGRGALRFGGKAGESVAKRAALAVPRATPYAAAQAVQQSGEEVAQQRIQEEAFNRPTGGILPSTWTPEEMQAFQDTFAAGGVMGLLGGLPGGFRRASSSPMQNPDLDAAQQIINQAQSAQNQAPIDTEPTAQPAMSVQEAQGRIFDEAGMQKILNQIFSDTYNQSDQFTDKQSTQKISGDNSFDSLDGFDSRFVSKWESRPGATDLAGVQPSVKNAFNAAIAEYGDGVTLTGGAEKGYHAAGETGHEGGWKIDVDKASVKDPAKFLQAMAKYGFQVGDEGDHYDLSGNAKGGVGGTVVATPDSYISNGQSRGTGKREGHANAWAAYDVFRKAGYNDEAIAGILGRLQQEHNFDTSNVEEYDDEQGRHLGGYGMFQWNGGRTTAFLNWAQENNLDPQNPEVQAQYALIEAQQRGLTPERMNQLTAEEAADVWTDEWEVGQRGSERQYAAEWRDRIKNGGSSAEYDDISSTKTKVDTSEEDKLYDEYNKQLEELAQNGIEAPFKTEQPTQKELVQQAKETAIESGDMDEVQRINSAERSGNKEELAKIAEKALKAKQKEVKGNPIPATPEIKTANPNLINKVKQLLSTAKEQGVKLDNTRLENTLKDGSEETLQNFAGMLQGMINVQGYENRKAKGKELLDYADDNRIDFKPGLRKMLREGQPKAIEAAQNIINEANTQQATPVAQQVQPTISNQETVQPQTAPVQKQSAQPSLNFDGVINEDRMEEAVNMLVEQEMAKKGKVDIDAKVKEIFPEDKWQKRMEEVKAGVNAIIDEPKAEQSAVAENATTDKTSTLKGDYDTFMKSMPAAGAKLYAKTLSAKKKYDGVEESRREHIEKAAADPNAHVVQAIRKKGTKDKYGHSQTDFQLYYGEVQKFPADFEYITQAEYAYFQHLRGEDGTIRGKMYRSNEYFANFAEDLKKQQEHEKSAQPTSKESLQVETTENEPMAVKKYRENAQKIVDDYRNGVKNYLQATTDLKKQGALAQNNAPDNIAKGQILDVYRNAVSKLDGTTADKSAETKKATDEGGKTHTELVREKLIAQKNKDYTNKATGIKARFGITGINKMLSNTAINKSIKNGYSRDEHLDAVEDVVSLYENAQLVSTEEDTKNKADNVLSIKRFIAEVEPGKNAKITVKESKKNGHRIYSLELEAIEKAPSDTGRLENTAYSDDASVTSIVSQEQEEVTQKDSDNGVHNTLTELQKAVKGNGRKALLNALNAGYKPVEGENAIESPDGVRYYLSKEETDTFKKDYEAKQEKPAETAKEEIKAVAKKYADGEISQAEAYKQVAAIAKDTATVPKDGLPNVTYIDGKIKQELNDYGDRLIDEVTANRKEVVENEQQGESASPNGGHSGVRAGESGADEREGTGEVFKHDGREGKKSGRGDGTEHSERPAPTGVRAGTELETAAGEGTDKRGNQSDVPLTEAEANPSPTEIPGHDYEIKDTDQSTKSEKVRFKQNVDAIKLLKQLEEDDRMPTPAEQEILGAYNGWGGLKNAFLDGNEMNKELRDLLTDEEYKAARSTINDAFYTPPKIIRAIWEGVSHLGFKGGRILDPSMGVGNFFGTMPRDMMEKSALRGVELDNLTSRFAKMLYPSAFVENKGFQKASVADNYFDLAISNIPFGQNMINGYQVHNYFFANGIDKVRPGGLMVYITSQGSLSGGKDAAKMRNYLSGQADLIAAYKLPSGVFSDAGTQVATDIVIFRKRNKDGKKSPYGQAFGNVKDIKTSWGAKLYDINEYFDKHPENILGEKSNGRDQWGNPALNVKMPKGTGLADVAKDLAKAMKKLPKDVYEPVSHKKSKAFDATAANKQAVADEKTRDYEYYYADGKVVQNQGGKAVEVTGKKAKVVEDYLKVKNTLNALLIAQRDPKATDKAVEGLRKTLNKDYDAFVAKHGQLTGTAASNFKDDPGAGMVQALEKPIEKEYTDKRGNTRKKIVGAEKADIFTLRTTQAQREVTHVEKADDALIASLTNRGGVDLEYMAGLMDSKPEQLATKLKGKIFKNPVTEEYETREEYLSGNVREKLAQAQEAARRDKAYDGNVKELEKIIPEDLVADEIVVNLGSPWIPEADVQAFAEHLSDNITVKFSRGAAMWTVTGWGSNANYKVQGIDLVGLLNHVLNNKAIQIFDGTGDAKVFNQEKTDAANVAADELQQEFKDWIWQDKEREKRLVRYYNDNYNNTVIRDYDGSHLTFPGMNAKIHMKPHQKNVVWRMLQGGNTLIAHCVGAGKTFEMQAAGMEMRRLGIANKPMYCLPNNVVEQFAREFRQLYPAAKLLVLQSNDLPAVEKTTKVERTADGRTKKTDLLAGKTPEQKAAIMGKRAARNRMLGRIRTEDWDGIIISHNLFQRFPVTPETAADFIQQEIDRLENTIREAKGEKNLDKRTLSSMETAKKSLEERLDDVISTDIDDIGIPFEELGIDQIFVDEADMFKNLEFATRLGQIRGLTNSNAARSRDMFIKTQWLTNNMGGRGVVFATGTPVSNTMSELYTMMRYLDMKGLKEKGLELFDNWMRTFGDIGQGIERKPTGDGFRKVTMIKRFINMADLTKMFRKFADVKTQDELDLEIPKLKNDKNTVVTLEADPKVVDYIKNKVPKRVAAMKSGFKKAKGEDNMLALTNDLRKLSLTDAKIEACADAIVKKYHDTTDVKGAQLVFCDMGIPKAESDKDSDTEKVGDIESPEVYRSLIAKLKEKGIPEKDIAFIQNYNTKTKRDAVFQKVNSGDVRILIGSTETMGAGTNCQEHLVALHDLDAPWRPRDLEQRHGRILRQGNENKEVEIFNYVVKDSFDANMWEKLKNKAAIIAQAMSGDMSVRTVEDADLVTLSYAEVEGAATGNPLIKEQLKVQNELTKYQHAQTAFRKKVRNAENTLAGSDERIAEAEKIIAKIEKDIAGRKDTTGKNFSAYINGKGYTERKKADEALNKVLDRLTKTQSVEIGQIGGFRLTGMKKDTGILLQLVGNRAYEVKTNSVAGIENTLHNAPEQALEVRQNDLKDYKAMVAEARKIVEQENPYAEKVKELSDRLNKLNREIENTLVDDGQKKAAPTDTAPLDVAPEFENFTVEESRHGQFTVKVKEPKTLTEEARDELSRHAKMENGYIGGDGYSTFTFIKRIYASHFAKSHDKGIERIKEEKPQVKEESKPETTAERPAVQEYKDKVDKALEGAKITGITSRYVTRIKQLIGDIELRRLYYKDLSNEDATAAKEYANKALEQLKQEPISDRIIVGTVPPAGKSTKNVNVDEFKHTKTGKMIPAASLKDHVDKDFRKQATAIAKNHGGKWSPFAKRILFKTEQGRDNFVREVEALLSAQEGKASVEGEIKRAMKNAKPVANEDLNSQQRKISEFGQQMGTPILWISADPKLHGYHAPNGTTVLNVRSNMDLSKTFWHETFHWVAGNNEALYNELLDYFKGQSAFSKAQLDAYRKRIGRPGMSDELTIEEMLADAFEEVTQRVKIFKEMGVKQPSLAKQFVAWVKRIMDRFAEFFHNPEGKLTTAQRDSFVKAFGRLARDIVDGNGIPLFKVYKEGKEIRLPSGELVTAGIKLSAENDIDNGGKVGDNEGKIKSIKVNNRLSLRPDGHFDVKLLKPRPSIGVESYNDRVERRKAEIEDMDRLLQLGQNPDAYAELLSDHTLDQIEEYRNRMGWTYVRLAQEYERKYNGFFAKYSPKVTEENVIGALMNLKGAIRYARQRGNISRRNRYAIGRDSSDGGKLPKLGAGNAEGTEAGRTEQVTTKHSEKGAFSNGRTKFSYSASDNSNDGLFQKIKNIMSGKASEDSEKFRYRKHLTEMIEKALDVKLRYGKMDGNKSQVVYKPEDRVLRSRHAFDWENILPVAGRIAAEKLGIEPTEAMNNYIADWILTGAPNNVSKEADTFHKAMREHPADSAKLEDLRDSFAEWLGKDYREQMQGTIQWKNKQKPTMQERKNRLYEEFVEELEPINRMVKQVNANLTEKGYSKLHAVADPMVAFRMLRGSYGRAMAALEGRNSSAVVALQHAFPNVDFSEFRTLYQILKSIDAFQNAEKQRDFVTYCTACHIMDMHQHNDDIRQEQQHLKNKIEKLGNSKEDEKKKAEYEKDIEKLSDELMPIPAAYSKDNCQKYIEDGRLEFSNAQQQLVHFSNTMAAILADSGVISEKRYSELLSKWQNYVPLFRVFEDNEDINFGDSMKHIKGSTRDIVNPLESIIRNTAQFVQKAELNKAKCLLADVARCDASGWLIEEVDKSDSDKTTITFWENGQRKYLQTDPDIVRAVNNMGADGSHFFIKFLHAITRLARACFTMASPEFALRNVARDWQDATLYTKYGMWVNPLDIVRGFRHAWRRDGVYYEWLTQGAAQASALSLDRDYTQSTLDKLGRGYWKRLTSRDWYNALLEGLQMAGEYSEYGTRIAMYQKTKAAILKDKPNATAEELHAAMLEAAFESRDLMDFARHGKAGAEYNKITAFANASIQGWDKLYRSLNFKEDPKRATRTAAKLILYGALPAMMIFAMYHDEDWYKDAPNWLKETHWLFKFGDTTIRIPKAADMGIRFISNAVEKGLDESFNKHPHKAKEYFLPMWDALPGMLPTSILPIIEIQANHVFFTDRPIIPQGQDKLPAKLQYGPYTTSLAKWIGETFDIAPRSVEHFIAGYTGTLGMAIPKAIDLVSGANQQSLSLEEMPLIRGYLYPQFKSPQSVNDFYNELDEQTKLKNEYKLTKKRPDGFDLAKLKRLENAQKMLRKISKQEKSIIDNPKWSIKDKEVMQRNIQKKRIEIAKRALGIK